MKIKPNPIMEFNMRRFNANYDAVTEYERREKTPSHSKIPNFGKSL